MLRGLSGDHPVVELLLEQWATLIFLPSVLLLIGVLVGVTAWWERRDAMARKSSEQSEENAAAPPRRIDAAPARSTPGAALRRAWRGRALCTCSWHAAVNGTTPAAARRAA